MNTLPTNLYTSTAAFTQLQPVNRWSPGGAISGKLDEWERKRKYSEKVFAYIQTLPEDHEEFMALMHEAGAYDSLVSNRIVDHKSAYTRAVSEVINLQRYLDLLRDDLDAHARHGTPIKSVDQYVGEYYHGLIPLAEQVLFDDHYNVLWSNVKHLEAIGFIVYWERNIKRLIVRWSSYELTV